MGIYSALGDAFAYPTPGSLQSLQTAAETLPKGAEKIAFQRFLRQVEKLSIGEWEELYTRTLDLNPMTAPYIGYQVWGESYHRGNFMAKLTRAYNQLSLSSDGELPDHLSPVLRYIDQAETPIPESVENLAPAVEKMQAELRKKKASNPYIDLFEAVLQSAKPLQTKE